MTGPNPQRFSLTLTPDTVRRHKKYDCEHYSQCLNQAAIENWSQFHCRDCLAYAKDAKPLDMFHVGKLYRTVID